VPAVVRLDFDPSTILLGTSVRLDMLALAGVVFVVLIIVALGAGRAGVVAGIDGVPDAPRLRRDDLILIAFGAVPGAVIGGRLGYGLLHLDYYRTDPGLIFDPGRGGMELTLALLLGSVTAISVARLLAAPIGRWLAVVAVPLLIGLAFGKLSMVLGGAGQGLYSDASYATLYVRPGLWGSSNADFGAVPSQALEGALVLAVIVVVLVVPFLLRLRIARSRPLVRPALAPRRDWAMLTGGRRFLTLLGLWAVARFAAVFTWRDAHILGPLAAEQLILTGVMVLAFGGPLFFAGWRRARAGIPTWRVKRTERRAAAVELARADAASKLEAEAALAGVTPAGATDSTARVVEPTAPTELTQPTEAGEPTEAGDGVESSAADRQPADQTP
jgi:prolipoprotein diacylglyceryltransferase